MPMIEENKALVEFISDAVQNNFKSAQEGRPIFDNKEFVRIQTPGDTKTVIYRVATAQDKQKFPRAYDLFKRGEQATIDGTPIEQWTQVTSAQVRELKHVGILSVETLAGVSDSNIQRMGPGYQQLQQRARQYLESAASNAENSAAVRRVEQLEEQIALLKEQNEALRAHMDASEKEKTTAKRPAARTPAKASDTE